MAAPFQTSGNVADIAPVQLKGGFTPSAGLAGVAAAASEVLLPVIRQNLEDEIVDDLKGDAGSIALALRVQRSPSLAHSEFTEEALADPFVRTALDDFFGIQEAVKQGKLPSTFALERLEIIQNRAIAASPAFEDEIRAAMIEATGQTPQKALFSRMLKETGSVQSDAQKGQAKAVQEAARLGMDVEKYQGILNSNFIITSQQNQIEFKAKQGQYTLNTMGADVANNSALLMADVMADVRRVIVSKGGLGVDDARTMAAQVNALFGSALNSVSQRSSSLHVGGQDIAATLKPLADLRDSTLKMIADGTMEELMSKHNDLITTSAENNILNSAEYGGIYTLVGKNGLLDFVKYLETANGSKAGKALLSSLSGDAKALFDLDETIRQFPKIGSGNAPVTDIEKRARVSAAVGAMQGGSSDSSFALAALEEIRSVGGDELAWASFNNNKTMIATARHNSLKAAFITLQASTSAGITTELITLSTVHDLDLDRLVITDAGLTLTPRKFNNRDTRLSDGKAHSFIARFNRANSISAKYSGAGLLSSARYTDSAGYWSDIRQGASDAVKPQDKPSVIKFVRDDNGNIVPDTGSK